MTLALYIFIAAMVTTLVYELLKSDHEQPFYDVRILFDCLFDGNKLDLFLYSCQKCMTWFWGSVVWLVGHAGTRWDFVEFLVYLITLAGLNIIIGYIRND